MKLLMPAFSVAVMSAIVTAATFGADTVDGSTATNLPDSRTLLSAPQDEANWSLPAKTYSGNRYTALTQIDKTNVGTLGVAWKTSIADDDQQEASPTIWNGTMYLSTPHDGVLALNAGKGKLLWQAPYNPAYVLLYAVNRGVGLADGKVFIATQDCRVIALDAATGRSLWNVQGQGCRDTSNSFYSMATYVYANLQGMSAPALTGPSFGRSHLSASQLRSVVTQSMPLIAPGSLTPHEYASVPAFLLSYDCVKPAGDGKQPLPTTDLPALQHVTLGATTCAPNQPTH